MLLMSYPAHPPLKGDTSTLSSPLSFSSTSSFDSSPSEDHHRIFVQNKSRSFSGIPFSWEKLPGIPKKQLSKKFEEPSLNYLPLPPSTGTPTSSKKLNPDTSFKKDPFFAAFVECSKDDAEDKVGNLWKGSVKITRSLSDRFAFVSIYGSCKSSCLISDSVVYVPKPRKHFVFNGSVIKIK